MKKFLAFIAAVICFASCQNMNDSKYTELNESTEVSYTSGNMNYETQWVSYPDSTYKGRTNLCVVKYYCDGNVIYTSEKFHFISLVYSYDKDNSIVGQHIVWFDKFQNPDENGWYKCEINKNEIPKEPGTHLSGIFLMNYYGDKYQLSVGAPMANAYLYNATNEIGTANDRNILSTELRKLYNAIN